MIMQQTRVHSFATLSGKMKVLILALVIFSLQALEAKNYNWSKIQPKLPPAYNPDYVPKKYPSYPKRPATIDTRAICGQPNSPPASRIVGGWETAPNELPWQVAIFIDDKYFCGGSLISDQWVLTAAHCAADGSLFDIYLGAHNVSAPSEASRLEVQVIATNENKVIHPNWNPNTLVGDMALIQLPEPVEFNDVIRPICLPPANEANRHVGDLEIVSGWGRPSDNVSTISQILRKTNSTIIDNVRCDLYYFGAINADHICIGTGDGHGTCNGDSGGPLSHVDVDGRFTQIGVVSFGSSRGCEVGAPGAFSRVSNYMSWISAVTGIITN